MLELLCRFRRKKPLLREALRADVVHELLRFGDVRVDGHVLQRGRERCGVEPDLGGNGLQRLLSHDVQAALVVRVLDAAQQPAAGASSLPAGLLAPHVRNHGTGQQQKNKMAKSQTR